MSQRRAVTRATATRYRSAFKGAKAVILDELCQLTGWHHDHAFRALRRALGPRRVLSPRKPRPPTYGEDVMVALRNVWAVMDAPAGKRMAPFLVEIVGRLRARGELDLDDATAAMLCAMSAATIDRRLPGAAKAIGGEGSFGYQTRQPVEVPDPDPSLNKDVRQRTLISDPRGRASESFRRVWTTALLRGEAGALWVWTRPLAR